MSRIFTIGFTGKNARKFFSLLKNSGGNRIIDIRLNNISQLAGYAKKDDLIFFLESILGWGYLHLPQLAPSKELLDNYKKNNGSWSDYETGFIKLLDTRNVAEKLALTDIENGCLLCSEHTPEFCHRRLVAEYLRKKWNAEIEIIHLY